jgi:predicted DNA-binding transcriptional regulator AlpA
MDMLYVSASQLAERYSVSRATVWRWAANGLLPKPVKLSSSTTRWRLSEIESRDEYRDVVEQEFKDTYGSAV